MNRGPAFRNGNAQRHAERLGVPWYKVCALVDPEEVRRQYWIDVARTNGLTIEQRDLIRNEISKLQKARYKRETIIEERRRRWDLKDNRDPKKVGEELEAQAARMRESQPDLKLSQVADFAQGELQRVEDLEAA